MAAETQPPSSESAAAAGRRSPPWFPALSSFLLASFAAVSLHTLFSSPISSPQPLQLPSPSTATPNAELQNVIKLGEGVLTAPEDICVDGDGIMYTATRDGWIKRLHRNGSWENWKNLQSSSLLGIAASKDGGIVVCDAEKGLLKVDEDGVSVLAASFDNGNRIISFADEVVEAEDGSLYFSDASSKFGLHNWYLDFLEARPHGRLLHYNPSSNRTSVLLHDLHFPNGVALSPRHDFLIFCESLKFRCLKYWLKGEKQGQTEVFVEDLPGAPDNINLAPDGSFWIALIQVHREGFEWALKSRILRHIIATYPRLVDLVGGMYRRATVVNVAEDGRIIRKLDDPTGKVMSFVTSALEHDGHLYLGSLGCNFIGKLPLKSVG